MKNLVAVVGTVIVVGLAIRWLRTGSAMTAADWARDPIEPDDLAG